MVMVPACTCLSRTWFWPRGVQSACVHINKRPGSACKEGQIGFYSWSYSSSSHHSWNPISLPFRVPAMICVGVCPRIDPWTRAGFDSILHLLIVVHRDHGWKDYPRVWFASSIVSWSLYLSLLLFEFLNWEKVIWCCRSSIKCAC